ncbi:MAG: hypothetical protein Q8O26_05025 [Phreatobacter sp.]|uniref:hypothetical protein n=1 Tax=Phreatobacter sp. TaxID=1966341 RepID=UPI002733095F|nr:hypothetical protein [Phreatobacter sp.]MDP2801229.1 hypothetical protein [Phreatobacter sp.]
MERRTFLTALAGGLAVTATTGIGLAEAAPTSPAAVSDIAAVRSALQPAAPLPDSPEEMQRRRQRRRGRWAPRRRWMRGRRRRCFINRRGLRVCRWS